jgi:UDP-N-acetylglucosamine/UDP-N-acetylgalactosamine 4-epimerase
MNILVTGGAGFIGSNLVESLLANKRVRKVRVLDNLATGAIKNIEQHFSNPGFEFMEGDIREPGDCSKACVGIHAISHQAALGSVPRSIADPIASHNVNTNGFLNMLEAARSAGIKRMVYASSSSVYGDLPDSPKVETKLGKVLSPYASTKLTNETYAESWAKVYEMQLIGFRYFNVFGPRQDPDGPYAAVIPLFIKAALTGKSPSINGDGSITRDFTPVQNVVQLNTNGMLLDFQGAFHKVVNVACGQSTSLNSLWDLICNIIEVKIEPVYGPVRKGDILQSLADITAARQLLDYQPQTALEEEMKATIDWYRRNILTNLDRSAK